MEEMKKNLLDMVKECAEMCAYCDFTENTNSGKIERAKFYALAELAEKCGFEDEAVRMFYSTYKDECEQY